jgi:hypothetical protein
MVPVTGFGDPMMYYASAILGCDWFPDECILSALANSISVRVCPSNLWLEGCPVLHFSDLGCGLSP